MGVFPRLLPPILHATHRRTFFFRFWANTQGLSPSSPPPPRSTYGLTNEVSHVNQTWLVFAGFLQLSSDCEIFLFCLQDECPPAPLQKKKKQTSCLACPPPHHLLSWSTRSDLLWPNLEQNNNDVGENHIVKLRKTSVMLLHFSHKATSLGSGSDLRRGFIRGTNSCLLHRVISDPLTQIPFWTILVLCHSGKYWAASAAEVVWQWLDFTLQMHSTLVRPYLRVPCASWWDGLWQHVVPLESGLKGPQMHIPGSDFYIFTYYYHQDEETLYNV